MKVYKDAISRIALVAIATALTAGSIALIPRRTQQLEFAD